MKLWQKTSACLTGVLLALMMATSWAAYDCDWDFYDDDCCEGPLEPCCFRIGLRMGGNFNIYTDKQMTLAIGTGGSGGIVGERGLPNFNDQFDVPYIAGMHLGFATTEVTEIFVEGEYNYGDGKLHKFESATVGDVSDKFHQYEHYAGYVGLRAFFCPWDNCYAPLFPFMGFKAGVVYHECVMFDENVPSNSFSQAGRTYFEGHLVPSIGGQIGIEFEICPCVYMAIMSEVIYSGGMRGAKRVEGGSGGAIQTLSIGDTGGIVTFPITIGFNAIV